MGVRRLAQDLRPHAQQVILTKNSSLASVEVERPMVKDVVIDGPGFVYHVYYKLLAYGSQGEGSDNPRLPTYQEINQGVSHLIKDLESCGANTQAVFFDGALPSSKRDTRRNRLEKTRIQLTQIRQSHRNVPPASPNPRPNVDYEAAFWGQVSITSASSSVLQPPFMVASAIEHLMLSPWAHVTHVVPEEGDVACARAATQSPCTILSNDSDLVLYQIHSESHVALLDSMTRTPSRGSETVHITMSALRPGDIVTKLRVSSLLSFAFERYMDTSVSPIIIAERTRSRSRSNYRAHEYAAFASLYKITPSPADASSSLRIMADLDPRTAEFVVQAAASSEDFQVYLPVLFEDPNRDSSWTYGTHLRQLGYSMVLQKHPSTITEYFRRGALISTSKTSHLSSSGIASTLSDALHDLNITLAHLPNTTEGHQPSLDIVVWHIAAAYVVARVKSRSGRPLNQKSLNALFFPSTQTRARKISWDDTHLYANVEAILYSFRVLKQLLGYIKVGQNRKYSGSQNEQTDELTLLAVLRRMPSIERLHIGLEALQREAQDISPSVMESFLMPLNAFLDTDRDTGTGVENPVQTSASGASKRKNAQQSGKTVRAVEKRQRNMFEVLQGESEEETEGG